MKVKVKRGTSCAFPLLVFLWFNGLSKGWVMEREVNKRIVAGYDKERLIAVNEKSGRSDFPVKSLTSLFLYKGEEVK